MREKIRPIWISLSLFLLLNAVGAFALDIPKLKARVTDLAGVLTTDQTAGLEEKLKQFEASDSTQIAILIIPGLEGEDLMDYSVRVATAWRLGQKGRDNGALLFIAMKERQVRIEVGYGLEPNLTDALSRRIIENEILPNFRQQQFFEGIDAGITAIMQTVRGAYQASPAIRNPQRRIGTGNRVDWLVFLLFPMLWLLASTGKWGGGVLGGGAGMYLVHALLGLTLVPMLIGSLVGAVIGVFLGALVQAGSRSSSHRRGGGFGGPFFPGGFGGGFGGGGGGFGGGGFSGGGGGFGGGGASGRW
ncbi:MAG: TPM domain-containing protein [Acidobacteriota bacterium]|jgi:uncharacterized protein